MPLSLLITALLVRQDPTTTAAPTPAPAPAFQTALAVAEPVRLALTPKLDGVIDDEEWDPLATVGSVKSYFQWEPGKLHVAATVPAGSDVVASVDLKSNGWLIGKDNVEIRLSNAGGTPKVSARLLDATLVSGPAWVELPGIALASNVVAKTDGTSTTFEATIDDAGLGLFPRENKGSLALRIDAVAAGAAPSEPFVPRALTPLTLSLTRAAAVPSGIRWNAEGAGNTVLPGDGIRIRLTFNGDDKNRPKRLAMRSEGLSKAITTEVAKPFPEFDKKGRAFVDYITDVPKDALVGYRILRGSLTGADDVTGLMQVSYRVAPLLDLDLVREPVKWKDGTQTVRLAYYLKSNSPRRVDGNVTIVPPTDFRVLNGNDKGFIIYTSHGSVRRVFELEVPPKAKGVFPIVYRVELGGKVTDHTAYLNID